MVSLLSPYFFKEAVDNQSTISDVSQNTLDNIDTQSNLTVCDDFNALESGEAREFIPYSYLLPSPEWSLCKVYRTNNMEFTMFLEPSNGTISGEKFMLSAKRVGDDFYISQYEGFASENENGVIPTSRYCAILKSVQRHNQSKKVRKWELLPASLGSLNTAPPLASISHSVLAQPGSGTDIRMVDVSLPNYHINETSHNTDLSSQNVDFIINNMIDKNNCQRNLYVWDLNKKKTKSKLIHSYFQNHDLANMKPNRLTSSISTNSLSSSSTSTSPTSSPTARNGRSKSSPTSSSTTNEEDRLSINIGSMIPMWDPSRNALLIKFMRNRVKLSSSKNFQFYDTNRVRSGKKWQNGSDVHISNAVVQFGKLEQNVYSLDFKNPVGPLHAFAMILSSFPEARYPQSSQ